MSVQADAIWQSIAEMPRPTLATLFADDTARVSNLSHRIPLAGTDILFDFSKTHLDAALIKKFEELSAAMHLAGMRDPRWC